MATRPDHRTGLRIARAMSIGLRALAVLCIAATASTAAQAQGEFYRADPSEIAGPPGTVIRQAPMLGAPLGAAAYRVLYRSTGMNGEPIAVSGIVVIPAGPAPHGGRPVVAWAHPTTGVVPRCAPSLAIFHFQQMQGLRELVERGFIVAATDYPGLGTPEPHPYLVGVSEARAVIDSVRAARALAAPAASGRYAVWGHSQGGHAALYAGLIANSYAPDLALAGVAVAAPATELAVLLNDDFNSAGGKNLTAMTLWSWARVFGAPIERVVEPSAIPVVDQLAEECIESIFDIWARQRTERPLEQAFLSVRNITELEPWQSLLARNTPGPLPRHIPVFIAQGDADTLVRPQVTRDYMGRLCRAGSRVRLVMIPGVGHGSAGRDAAGPAVERMAGRLAGTPAPSDCGR